MNEQDAILLFPCDHANRRQQNEVGADLLAQFGQKGGACRSMAVRGGLA